MSDCSGTCSTCESGCSTPESLRAETHELNNIKRVIGVVSGKGGVGKSLVTAMLAVQMNRKGHKVAILDADVIGPSIPKMFGLKEMAKADDAGMYPVESQGGIKVMSMGVLIDDQEAPMVWRGPVVSGVVKQFWTDVIWEDVDYMFVDMPPGTSDVPLTVMQSLPLDCIIVVTSPQDLVSVIVKKAMVLAAMLKVPVMGVVENYSCLKCPDCGKEIPVFGKSHAKEVCDAMNCALLGRIPINTKLSEYADAGTFDDMDDDSLLNASKLIEMLLPPTECTGTCTTCPGCATPQPEAAPAKEEAAACDCGCTPQQAAQGCDCGCTPEQVAASASGAPCDCGCTPAKEDAAPCDCGCGCTPQK